MGLKDTILMLVMACLLGCTSLQKFSPQKDKRLAAKKPQAARITERSEAAQCLQTKEHFGFAGRVLDSDMVGLPQDTNRMRLKPFSVLASEYQRLLKAQAQGLDQAQGTFVQNPDRWSSEPEASAVGLVTLYKINFNTALRYIQSQRGDLAAPDISNTASECQSIQRQIWDMKPTPKEIAACSEYILNETVSEPDYKKRWAYGFAAVLTAAGFLAY